MLIRILRFQIAETKLELASIKKRVLHWLKSILRRGEMG